MKSFIALLGLCALATCSLESSSSEEGDPRAGLAFSGTDVLQACTAGSQLGAKLSAALASCSGGQALQPEISPVVAAGRRWRGPGRGGRRPGRGPRCPTAEMVKSKMGQKMAGDMCVLSTIGWVDEQGNESEATAAVRTADVMSLPAEVSSMLTDEAVATCAEQIGLAMSNKPGIKRCAGTFSEAEQAELKEMGSSIASYKCFKKIFMGACQMSVKNDIYAFFEAKAAAAAAEAAAAEAAAAEAAAAEAAEAAAAEAAAVEAAAAEAAATEAAAAEAAAAEAAATEAAAAEAAAAEAAAAEAAAAAAAAATAAAP